MNQRFFIALAAYAVLFAIAAATLNGLILKGTLLLLAALTVKTLIAWKAGW